MEAEVRTTSVRMVVTDHGGFPVDNIAYWKEVMILTGTGERSSGLMVAFRSGGFIELPGMPLEQFQSLVYGEPF